MEESDKNKFASSSMVDLKAELYRKQEEFKKQKAFSVGFLKGKKSEKPKDAKKDIWNRQNPGVSSRAKRDLEDKKEVDPEEDEMLAKSRKALEQKAKLYNKILTNPDIPEEDGSEYYLVDFQKKAIDTIVADREAEREKAEMEAERQALEMAIPEPSCPDEEWVDFTDSLGRQRRCLRKDLKDLMKKDEDLASARKSRASVNTVTSSEKPSNNNDDDDDEERLPHLMSTDMHKEMMRQKWEKEARELMERGQEEIHYANVQFDEIRTHGVGFYQFSKDHTKREEELEKLKDLREKTKDERSRKDKVKDKRKALMEARLAKVRQRRNLKAPELKEEANQDEKTDKDDEEFIGPKLSESFVQNPVTDAEIQSKTENEEEAEEKRKNHVREWDKQKLKSEQWSAKNYVEARRSEREDEFAPPSVYFNDQSKKKFSTVADAARLKRLQESIKPARNSQFAPPATYDKEKTKMNPETAANFDHGTVADTDVDHIPLPPVSSELERSRTQVNVSNISHKNLAGPSDFSQNAQSSTFQTSFDYRSHSQQVQNPQPIPSGHVHPSYFPQNPHFFHQQPASATHLHSNPATHLATAAPPPPPSQNVFPQNYPTQTYNPQWNTNPNTQGYFQCEDNSYPTSSTDSNFEDSKPQTNGQQQQQYPLFCDNQLSSTGSQVEPKSTEEEKELLPTKKPKVPKLAIVDTRFMSSDTAAAAVKTEPEQPISVSAVPFKPGSFSAGKYITAAASETHTGASPSSAVTDSNSAHISQIPVLYTKEQQMQQSLDIDKTEILSEEVDKEKKLQDFLASVK